MRFSRFIILFVVAGAFVGIGWALAQGESEWASQSVNEADNRAEVASPLGKAFTYQGYLTQNGAPYTGVCDLQFTLWDSATGGNQIGATQTLTQANLSAGRFTVAVNSGNEFGPAAFNGESRWLQVAARCSIAGGYTTLSPRQPLRGVPYALGLQPGAIISGTLPAAGTLVLDNGAENGFSILVNRGGMYVESAGDGFHIESAVDEGFQVDAAGDNGLFVGTAGDHGLEVDTAVEDGIRIETAGDEGVDVVNAGNNGFAITNAGTNGVYVDEAGQDGVRVDDAGGAGIRVNAAAGDGLFIGKSGSIDFCEPDNQDNGVEICNTAGNGIDILNAGGDGLQVTNANESAINIFGFNAYGINVGGGQDDISGYFHGDIIVGGTCSGCRLSAIGINSGVHALQPGDVVAIQGVVRTDVDNLSVLWEVVPMASGLTPVGVVAGRAELQSYNNQTREHEIPSAFEIREGAAAPGEHVTIITYGPYQVRVAPGTPLMPGDYVLPAENGMARRMDPENARVADMLSSIGIALSTPDADGLVWVLVNGH